MWVGSRLICGTNTNGIGKKCESDFLLKEELTRKISVKSLEDEKSEKV